MRMILCTTGFIHLYGRTFDSPVTAKHATIACHRLENCVTILTLVKILAGIGRHQLFFAMVTGRTRDS
jgi:hypothetical protein